MLVNVIDRHGVLSTVYICEKTSQLDVGTNFVFINEFLSDGCS